MCVPTFDAELHVQADSNAATQRKLRNSASSMFKDDAFSP